MARTAPSPVTAAAWAAKQAAKLRFPEHMHREAERLRNTAYYVHLDGRTARAKEMNRRADALDKRARSSVQVPA